MKNIMLSVPSLLKHNLKTGPSKEALAHHGTSLSYSRVYDQVKILSSTLTELGVKKGDRIGIYMEKCVEKVFAIFAVSNIGGIFVIINPLLPDNMVSYIIKDCGINGIISSTEKLGNISMSIGLESIDFVLTRNSTNTQNDHPGFSIHSKKHTGIIKTITNPRISGSDIASIIYTSGSTGLPKGVVLTHKNIVLSAQCGIEHLNNTENDRILSLLPFSFDYGLFQLTSCFKVGGTLVLKKFLLTEEIVETIVKENITGIAGVPSLWIRLSQARNIKDFKFENLRYITNSGDRLPVKYVTRLHRIFPHTKIFLMYGFTEAFRATYLDPDHAPREKPDSIGKDVPYSKIYVLNKSGDECTPEEIGELAQSGPLVSKGYWERSEETKEKIRPNHLTKQKKDLLCYSGDLVKKDKDGYFYFIGRNNFIIKSLGYRISPTEIETVLYKNKKVKDAVAIGIPDEFLGQRIKVIITLKGKVSLEGKDIIDFTRKYLPNYMVPKEVLFLKKLPLTPNGKVDRKYLLEKYGTKPDRN